MCRQFLYYDERDKLGIYQGMRKCKIQLACTLWETVSYGRAKLAQGCVFQRSLGGGGCPLSGMMAQARLRVGVPPRVVAECGQDTAQTYVPVVGPAWFNREQGTGLLNGTSTCMNAPGRVEREDDWASETISRFYSDGTYAFRPVW